MDYILLGLSITFSLIPIGIYIGSFVFKIDPYYHLLQNNLPGDLTSSFVSIFIMIVIRFILLVGFFDGFRYACAGSIGLCIMWSSFYQNMSILALLEDNCVGSVLTYHNQIVLCYALIHHILEKMISVGTSAVFWLLVIAISSVIFFMDVLPNIVAFFLLLVATSGGFGFVCALGLVVQSNDKSRVVLKMCSLNAKKLKISENRKHQGKLDEKRAKACIPMNILYRPLGPINKDFQMEYVNTLKDRVMDFLLINI